MISLDQPTLFVFRQTFISKILTKNEEKLHDIYQKNTSLVMLPFNKGNSWSSSIFYCGKQESISWVHLRISHSFGQALKYTIVKQKLMHVVLRTKQIQNAKNVIKVIFEIQQCSYCHPKVVQNFQSGRWIGKLHCNPDPANDAQDWS